MIGSFHTNYINLQFEDLQDLVLGKLILEGASTQITTKIRSDLPNKTKDEQPIEIKKTIFDKLKVSLCKKNLILEGLTPKGFRKHSLVLNTCLKVWNLKPYQEKLISQATIKKIFYLALDTQSIVWGEINPLGFKPLHLKYYNFKTIDFENYITNILSNLPKSGYVKYVFKAPNALIKTLNQFTNVSWTPLENDILLDWKFESLYESRWNELRTYFFKFKHKCLTDPEDITEAIYSNNLARLYFTSEIPDQILAHLPNLIGKFYYVNKKTSSNWLIEKGVLGFSYF